MNFLSRNLRHLMGDMSQVDLAAATGVNQTTISRILKPEGKAGIRDPGMATFKPIAEYFGVSLDDFLTRDIAQHGRSPASQDSGIDKDKLGTALTAVEKALMERGVSGQMGKVAPAVIWAYDKLGRIPQAMNEDQRELFDAGVKLILLGESYDRHQKSRPATNGSNRVRSPAKATGKKTGPSKSKRRS